MKRYEDVRYYGTSTVEMPDGQYCMYEEVAIIIQAHERTIAEKDKEIEELNIFIEKAFKAHPNLDLDIEYYERTNTGL